MGGYVLHLKHRQNCSVIESMKRGHEVEVLVIPENNPAAEPETAKAKLSQNGEVFTITIAGWSVGFMELCAFEI